MKFRRILVLCISVLLVMQCTLPVLATEYEGGAKDDKVQKININKLKSHKHSIIKDVSIDEDGAISYTEIVYIDYKKFKEDRNKLGKSSSISINDYIIEPLSDDPGEGAVRITYTYDWGSKSLFSSHNQTLLNILQSKTFKYISTIGTSFISNPLISIFTDSAITWTAEYLADADAYRKPRYTWKWIEVYDGQSWDDWYHSTRREYFLYCIMDEYLTENGEFIDTYVKTYYPDDGYDPLEESYGDHFYNDQWLIDRAIDNYNYGYYGDYERYQDGVTEAYGFPD